MVRQEPYARARVARSRCVRCRLSGGGRRLSYLEETRAGAMLEFAPGICTDRHRILAMAGACDVVRSATVRPRDKPAELHGVAGDRRVAADRRLARAVEHGKKGALA